MSKFLCLGMSLAGVIGAATEAPARAIRRDDLGHLRVGAAGDASILDLRQGDFEYEDCDGETITGNQRLFPAGLVLGGKWWE